MADAVLVLEGGALSQTERVVDTLVAPSKTFTDVLRSASWWLPFLLIAVCGYVLTFAVQSRVGWQQLLDNEMRGNPKLADQMTTLTPEQAATRARIMTYSFQGGFYAGPLFTLFFVALASLVLWATINFGFGGKATYGRVFCVGMYAALPGAISALLAAVMLFAGRSPDGFTTRTMLGSNPGYYLETPGALKTFLTGLDVFQLWTAVLFAIGLAIVARTKPSSGYLAVFGWFVVILLIRTLSAALSS